MRNFKKIFTFILLIALMTSNFYALAFEDVDISFDLGVGGWTRISDSGEISMEYTGEKSCLTINSPKTLAVYEKAIDEKITSDGGVYVLSYDVMIPQINTDSLLGKQTVVMEGHSKNSINSFYGLRIDNGVISYFNGTGQYNISTAYQDGNKSGEKLSVSENEWHNLKSVYNRSTATFTYYVDDMPLLSEDGSVLTVPVYETVKDYEIEKLVVRSRNIDEDKIYIDNISLYKSDVNYKELYKNFNNGTDDMTLYSGTGTITLEESVSGHANCAYIYSPGATTYYLKSLEQNIASTDKGIYELSYDLYLTKLATSSPKQTISVIALGTNKVNSFYGLRIDNGVISYYNGKGQYDVSTAYKDSSPFVIEAGMWHTIKSIYDRNAGTFTYYVDGEPLLTTKGDIIKINIRNSEINNTISDIAVISKTSSDEIAYFDNIYLRKVEKLSEEKYVNIYNVDLNDNQGNSVDFNSISGKTNLKIDFDYDATKNFICAAALYKENALADIILNKVDVSDDGFVSKVSFDVLNSNNADEIRFYSWNTLENITPYKFMKKSDNTENVAVSLNSTDIENDNFSILANELEVVSKNLNSGILLKAPVMGNDESEIQNKKYNSDLGGPVKSYYIDFTVKNKSFHNRKDGAVFEVEVEYFDEGYGCFTIEYDSLNESLKEAEYVELNNSLTWKKHTFILDKPYFTGDGTDFRLSTWGDIMRYSNFDVAFKSVSLKNCDLKSQFDIKHTSDKLGNILYTGEDITFTTKISNRAFYEYSNAFGTYNATLKYTLVDENKNDVKTIGEKTIEITPVSEISDTVTFSVDKYGLYYLKTEIESEDNLLYSKKFTELSYVNSDKTTVNDDFGTSMQATIYSVKGSEELAKNAGIGMLRWVRPMGDIMSLSYDADGYTLKEKGWSSDWTAYQNTVDEKGYKILNNLLARDMVYSDETYKGYKLQVPYGDEGRDIFSQYCNYFAKNAPSNTEYYEIWNEFDSGLGSAFNKNYESWEKYGDLLVKATDAILSEDEDAEIVVLSSRFVNTHTRAIDRVKEILNSSNTTKTLNDYFANASIHPYHWSDNPMNFTSDEFIDDESTLHINTLCEHMKELKDVYDQNGLEDTKLWISEIAWSPHYTANYDQKPITEKQQGSYLVQSYVMSKKENITEKFLSYLFARQTSVRVDRDKNMGILKNYKAAETEVPLAATSAYLAISNLNMLMTNAAYVNDFYFDNSEDAVAYHFKRENQNDLAILWSIYEEGKDVALNIGCKQVTMYDEYGNATLLTSESGIYNLNLTQSTVYLEGTFTEFKQG